MSGNLSGTVVTLFPSRDDVRSLLPPELTFVEDDQLPDWIREQGGHPVILIIAQNETGKRMRMLGEYRTVPLFRPFLETFVAVPFLKPRDSAGPCPCFHFARVYCETFWPTELGVLCVGWPKRQRPMRMSEQGQVRHYSIGDERGSKPLLSAETDFTDSAALDPKQDHLSRVVSMMSQPLVLVKNRCLHVKSFDFRFEAATLRSVPASVTIRPGFFPFLKEPTDFSFPKISDGQFGAFFLETTFMNRPLGKT